MIDDAKFWLIFVVTVFTFSLGVIITRSTYYYSIQTAMADRGYEEVAIVGSNQTAYHKVR